MKNSRKNFDAYKKEIPYAVEVETEEFFEKEKLLEFVQL